MQNYSSPELVVIGPAALLVLGPIPGLDDHVGSFSELPMGLAAGLDD